MGVDETDGNDQRDQTKPTVLPGYFAADHLSHSARVLIGVCTYNESTNVREMTRRLRGALPDADVLYIDDNSPDGTADLVREISESDSKVRLIVRTQERGLGGAILRAAVQSVTDNYDFFINLDGDLSHDPAELPLLLNKAIENPQVDVVVGSRYTAGGKIVGWPLRRRMMSRFVNRFATLCLRLPVSDCSGSMRCYRVAALKRLDLESLKCRGYALLEELLVKLKHQGSEMAEVPITFTERQHGESKLTISEAVRSMTFMMKLAVTSKRG